MRGKLLTKVCATILSAATVVSMSSGVINVFAEETTNTYSAPTQPMAVDENIVTASAHRAASPILGILGVNAIAGFGMINGSAPSDLASAEACAALGIWGTSLNENPDPYYWNYFYNFYAEANGEETVEDALINSAAAASPNQADNTTTSPIGGVSISVYTQPDILVGVQKSGSSDAYDKTGYDEQIAILNKELNIEYSPKLVSYNPSTLDTMIQTMKEFAAAIKEVEEETGKTTRYGDPEEIAEAYEQYINGIQNYINANITSKKTIAIVNGVNSDGTYSAITSYKQIYYGASSDRFVEYTIDVANNIADQYDTNQSGSANLTAEQLKGVDAILVEGGGTSVANELTDDLGDDMLIIATAPSTLYGLTQNSVENAMGLAYYDAYLYQDVIDINPVEVCAYFYKTFLHVTDADSLQTVVSTNFADVVLPEGVTNRLSANWETRMNSIVATQAPTQSGDEETTGGNTETTTPSGDEGTTTGGNTETTTPSGDEGTTTGGNTGTSTSSGDESTTVTDPTNTSGQGTAVNTGDSTHIVLYAGMLACVTVAGAYTYKRKRD